MNGDKHTLFMREALIESRKAAAFSSPNPHVGAIIVKNNKIIGRGHTQAPGQEHAEVMAIRNARQSVSGSSLYVTLEPCCHFGRTSPCAGLIIKKKIKNVFVGMTDPNPVVCHKGISLLKNNKIMVRVGILKEEIEQELQWYIKTIYKKAPYITLKAGVSLDGKITDFNNNSKWVTSEKVRNYSRRLRENYDGIIAGINTVIKDDPLLSCPDMNKKKKFFYRIILDTNLKIDPEANALKPLKGHFNIIAAGDRSKNSKKIRILRSKGAEILFCRMKNNVIDLKGLLRQLGAKDIARLIVEGGSEVNYSFLNENMADKVILFIAPKIIGGAQTKGWIGGKGFLLNGSKKIIKGKFYNLFDSFMFEGYINYYKTGRRR